MNFDDENIDFNKLVLGNDDDDEEDGKNIQLKKGKSQFVVEEDEKLDFGSTDMNLG